MRRIYESDALERDDDEPFTPRERDADPKPQAMRSVPSGYLSKLLVPMRIRHWALSVDVETPASRYTTGDSVPFRVTMKNSLPIPITIPTRSPVLWTWAVNGDRNASRLPITEPDDQPRGFHFDRGERKQFRKRWNGMFKVSHTEWEPATPGKYTITAQVNTDRPAKRGLQGQSTITIVEE